MPIHVAVGVACANGNRTSCAPHDSKHFLKNSTRSVVVVPPRPASFADIGLAGTHASLSQPSAKFDSNAYIVYYVYNMSKGEYLGEFEHIVLLTILRLGDGAYSGMIRAEIEHVTGRSPAIGAVHKTLERLERKRLASSWIGEPTAERGGKAKRHFKIEVDGLSVLKSARKTLEQLHAGISLRTATA